MLAADIDRMPKVPLKEVTNCVKVNVRHLTVVVLPRCDHWEP